MLQELPGHVLTATEMLTDNPYASIAFPIRGLRSATQTGLSCLPYATPSAFYTRLPRLRLATTKPPSSFGCTPATACCMYAVHHLTTTYDRIPVAATALRPSPHGPSVFARRGRALGTK